MPIITSIKPQKSGDRVNIYLDGKFGFGIDYENYVKYKLRVESELSESEIEKIKGQAEFAKILAKILDFASRRPRSRKEFELWLKRKKAPENLHEELFNRLNEYDFLDDEEFARWWVGERLAFGGKSKRILNQELRIKGVDKEIIQMVLGELDIDEVKIARGLLEKKMYKWERLEGDVRKKKMSEYLARNGFSWDIIKEVINIR